MKQTSFFLDDASMEMLEKYFRGKQSLSCAVRLAVEKLVREGVPVRMYGSYPGLNLSFTLREYLRTQFL